MPKNRLTPQEENESVLSQLDESDIFKALKPREIQYVKEFVRTGSMTMAVTAVGYKNLNSGRKIAKSERVKRAIDVFRAHLAKRAEYTNERHIKRLEERIEQAIAAKQFTAAMNGEKTLAVITGAYQEKHNVTMNHAPLTINIMGISPPSYANRAIDVTPPIDQIISKKDDNDGTSSDE